MIWHGFDVLQIALIVIKVNYVIESMIIDGKYHFVNQLVIIRMPPSLSTYGCRVTNSKANTKVFLINNRKYVKRQNFKVRICKTNEH